MREERDRLANSGVRLPPAQRLNLPGVYGFYLLDGGAYVKVGSSLRVYDRVNSQRAHYDEDLHGVRVIAWYDGSDPDLLRIMEGRIMSIYDLDWTQDPYICMAFARRSGVRFPY